MTTSKLTWDEIRYLDPDQAWNFIRKLDQLALTTLVVRAVQALPASALESVFRGYAHPHEVARRDPPVPQSLLSKVQSFASAAYRGAYYEPFLVDSRTFSMKSSGTMEFEVTLHALFGRCIAEAKRGDDPKQVCTAYDVLFTLLHYIDECHDDVIFWGDEGGTWQFGIVWREVLPPYFQCLAHVVDPAHFQRKASAVVEMLDVGAEREGLLRLVTR